MRIAVTGTPGTGKTSATELLPDRFGDRGVDLGSVATDGEIRAELSSGRNRLSTDGVCHLNDLLESESLYTDVDEDRDSVIADLDALEAAVDDRAPLVVESHLSHHLQADRVVVLRCEPTELERRLRDRGESAAKARENAESEALDVILAEAVEIHGRDAVYEIDTTDIDPVSVADRIADVVVGKRDPSAGTVDFVGYLG
ncbi:adenylate kinase family protein [Halovivax cerinus]|uniref:Putative adenylate kinase n=1 Tax=Halovivax cerinus TaxID=1487865 RepID=A0ABD5NMX2_9EURY|nr:adenylate kinase family protein [Halovivax cerinus]